MQKAPVKGADRAWHHALAGALILAGPIARYLYYERYPLATPEALIPIVGLAILGAGLAWLGWRVGSLVAALVLAGLLVVNLDLTFDLHQAVSFKVLAAGCLILMLALTRHRAALAVVVFGTFYLVSLASRSGAARETRRDTPRRGPSHLLPAVHVVLDEQGGVGGFRAAGDTATARFLERFYTSRGFDLYGGAYSRLYYTRNSVPAVLSLGESTETDMVESLPRDKARVVENPYFASLAEQGYRIGVYQSDYIDYCAVRDIAIATCVQMPAVSVSNVRYLDATVGERVRRIIEFHLSSSSYLAARVWPLLGRRGYGRSAAGRSVDLLRAVAADLAKTARGPTFAFVHALLPHPPFETDERCRFRRTMPAWNPADRRARLEEPVALAREGYRRQVRCAHRVLGELIETVDRAFGRDSVVVIVHGDHGPRHAARHQATTDYMADFRTADLNGAFATLLAVRYPGSRGRVTYDAVPVQDFLWAFSASHFTRAPAGPWQHFVYFVEARRRTRWATRSLRLSEMLWADSRFESDSNSATLNRIASRRF